MIFEDRSVYGALIYGVRSYMHVGSGVSEFLAAVHNEMVGLKNPARAGILPEGPQLVSWYEYTACSARQ
jgi:hypothetical protein